MFLALGEILLGSPFYGVMISDDLMLLTFGLMLLSWVKPRCAVLVCALFALVLAPGMYWTDSYWGGAVAASGGALLFLGIGLSRKRQTPLAGAVLAVGILLLFWSRPYEGGVLTLAVLGVFAGELWRGRRIAMFATALALFVAGLAWTAYDDSAVTGSPFLLPYVLHQRQYEIVPNFWFLPIGPQRRYDNARLDAEHGVNGWEASKYLDTRRRLQSPIDLLPPALQMEGFPVIALGLLTLVAPLARGDPRFVKVTLVAAAVWLALACETFHFEHYRAPLWVPIALMIAFWAERARDFWDRRPVDRGVLFLVILVAMLPLGARLIAYQRPLWEKGTGISSPDLWSNRRAALIRRLSVLGSPELVIVRYPSPNWHIEQEWVYNSANIDQQRVIFAHDLGAEEDRALLDYYPNRLAVLLTFDPVSGREELHPYPRTGK